MWMCIGFIVYLGGILPISDNSYETQQIGTYKSEKECMNAGNKWINKHQNENREVEFICEKEPFTE